MSKAKGQCNWYLISFRSPFFTKCIFHKQWNFLVFKHLSTRKSSQKGKKMSLRAETRPSSQSHFRSRTVFEWQICNTEFIIIVRYDILEEKLTKD